MQISYWYTSLLCTAFSTCYVPTCIIHIMKRPNGICNCTICCFSSLVFVNNFYYAARECVDCVVNSSYATTHISVYSLLRYKTFKTLKCDFDTQITIEKLDFSRLLVLAISLPKTRFTKIIFCKLPTVRVQFSKSCRTFTFSVRILFFFTASCVNCYSIVCI